ncbi:TetR/AcrR family transcriptional regulator [Petroclostridium sp. X23]|uniref:TetR/AcrR family transcriptional regulator n=1 Tax=Petroclostridium sp. X23 TaxID=3045146 RepID=UPI0024ADCE5A|nr:TetR/AcrR family transcriptional regulator [Petroclostridium sp. X23]WHH60087.1 TetR/AcrR family transcriptional regulator [Petroclostridium sp. X23]
MYRKYLKRKEKIIICAIDILDEVGIQGLTMKEIAKRQGITEPAVYKQFSGKQEVILTILERFSTFDEGIRNTIRDNNMNPKDGLNYFINSYVEYYENYPQITTVLFSFDVYRYQSDTNNKMQCIIQERQKFVDELIRKGQTIGEFKINIESKELASIILGLLWSFVFEWKMSNCSYSLKEKVLSALGRILE